MWTPLNWHLSSRSRQMQPQPLSALSTKTLPWHVLKVREEGNNAIVNIALELLIVHALSHSSKRCTAIPSTPCIQTCHVCWACGARTWSKASSFLLLMRSTVAASTQAYTVLRCYSQKCQCSYAMTLQKSNLAFVGEGCGMRLLAYHPLSFYSRWQRYPSCQHLVSNASSSHQKLVPQCIQQRQIQIKSKRPWKYWTMQDNLRTLSNKCISPWLEMQ